MQPNSYGPWQDEDALVAAGVGALVATLAEAFRDKVAECYFELARTVLTVIVYSSLLFVEGRNFHDAALLVLFAIASGRLTHASVLAPTRTAIGGGGVKKEADGK